MAKIPHDTILHDDFDVDLFESEDYMSWTVRDIIEMLSEYPQDAPVYYARANDDEILVVSPIEVIGGDGESVFLS